MTLRPDHIKTTLRSWIGEHHLIDENDVLIEELCFVDRKRRADLVHANGKLSAYEIKSEADSLVRWRGQEEAYHLVFDEVWICCHFKHLSKALNGSKQKTGVMVFDDFSNMAIAKPAEENKNIDFSKLLSFLWKENLQSLCYEHDIRFRKSDSVMLLRQIAINNLPKQVLKNYVLNTLKARYS